MDGVKTRIIEILKEKPRTFSFLRKRVPGFTQMDLAVLCLNGLVEYAGHPLTYRLKERNGEIGRNEAKFDGENTS